jgi:hypothetical protein
MFDQIFQEEMASYSDQGQNVFSKDTMSACAMMLNDMYGITVEATGGTSPAPVPEIVQMLTRLDELFEELSEISDRWDREQVGIAYPEGIELAKGWTDLLKVGNYKGAYEWEMAQQGKEKRQRTK